MTTEIRIEARAAEPGARAFVWGVWGLLTLATVALVALYGTDVPIWDDYAFVPAMVGDQAVTPAWLWEQSNEHRIPLPKLLFIGAGRLAGNDVRAGMAASAAALAVLAAALVVLAGRLRGGVRPSDAVFPILLLHPGHAPNLLWGIQFIHVLATALGAAYLVPIAARASWPGPAASALAGAGLVLLPLCGGTGLVYVPGLAVWLFGAAWAAWRSGRPGSARRAAVYALSAAPGLAVTGLYFRGFVTGAHPEHAGGAFAAARTGVQFLTGGVGMPAWWAWPWSGAVTLGLLGFSLVLLGRAWAFHPDERARVFGLVAFLAAMGTMAAGVGWGRGWAGDRAGFQARYVTMAAPLWCWFVVVVRLYAPPALGGLSANSLFAAACVLYWPNAEVGLGHGRGGLTEAEALARDVRSGMPPYLIVRRYTPYLHPSQDEAGRLLPMLRRAGVGPFRDLRPDPPFRETRLPVTPVDTSLARWDPATSTAHVTGVDPQLTYQVSPPRRVAGLRLRYSHANPQGAPARFQLTWKRPGQPGYSDTQRYANWTLPTGEGRVTTVWLDELLSEFRIQPDNQPCEFRVDEIVLLEP